MQSVAYHADNKLICYYHVINDNMFIPIGCYSQLVS